MQTQEIANRSRWMPKWSVDTDDPYVVTVVGVDNDIVYMTSSVSCGMGFLNREKFLKNYLPVHKST